MARSLTPRVAVATTSEDIVLSVARAAALRFQWALAVQILLAAPIRLGNLTGLELDQHLLRVGSGRRFRYHLVIPGEEVKNGCPVDQPLVQRNLRSSSVRWDEPCR